jgi:hypothetical protein
MSSTKSSRTTSGGLKPSRPSLSQKELVRVYGRIHSLLARRVRSAKRENDRSKGKDKRLRRIYAETAKELYAYVRLMELCQHLSKDVADMHVVLDSLSKSTLTWAGGGEGQRN